MKWITATAAALLLSGCSLMSFYDDNESMLASNVRMSILYLDCKKDAKSQAQNIKYAVDHLYIYSESKGSDDVLKMVTEMKKTSDGLANNMQMSETYCNLKRKVLEDQARTIADAIMGRF